MSPRAGGEAAKFGDRYEAAWTIRHVLYVLDGRAQSITPEDFDDFATGGEFTYRRADGVEVHQVKRQHGTANSWSVKSLQDKAIWEVARQHIDAGREYHFVSTLPAAILQQLCDLARRSGDQRSFVEKWLQNEPHRRAFTELSSPHVLGSPDSAWRVLRGTWIEWPDERDVEQVNAVLSEFLLKGAPGELIATGLSKLVLDNLGVELTATAISERLPQYKLARATALRAPAVIERVNDITASWASSVERELLQPVIARDEALELTRLIAQDKGGTAFLIGAAGGGKSAALYQAMQGFQQHGMSVLAFRLDRLEPFASTTDLGRQLGLSVSPVAALAAVADERASVLVIDQLDTISFASGRMPRSFDVIADLIREASAFPSMRIVLACRKFDVDNDHRIRHLAARVDVATVTVNPLSDDQVDAAVAGMGLTASDLTPRQKTLLRSPLHLVLLATVASEPNALDFRTTTHLFDAYRERKRRDVNARRQGTRFDPVVTAVAEAISARQRLSVPMIVLDQDDLANDADVLVSEHVLVQDGNQVSFFHEAFFDYAFARHWVSRNQSLVDFLTASEQELFRRAQVRQIMTHLRDTDPERFVEEVRGLLTADSIRFHIKDAALTVLSGLMYPTKAESDMLLGIAATHPSYEARLRSGLRTAAWFARLNADGHIAAWLRDGEEQQNQALNLMPPVARTAPDRLAELLAHYRETPPYPSWLRWVVRFADLGKSRDLFVLFLDAVRRGLYTGFERELWSAVDDVVEEHPDWAVEVLEAFLINRPEALTRDEQGRIAVLKQPDAAGARFVAKAAAGAPQQFCEALIPYLLQVMEDTGLIATLLIAGLASSRVRILTISCLRVWHWPSAPWRQPTPRGCNPLWSGWPQTLTTARSGCCIRDCSVAVRHTPDGLLSCCWKVSTGSCVATRRTVCGRRARSFNRSAPLLLTSCSQPRWVTCVSLGINMDRVCLPSPCCPPWTKAGYLSLEDVGSASCVARLTWSNHQNREVLPVAG